MISLMQFVDVYFAHPISDFCSGDRWNYSGGLVLRAAECMYIATHDEKYLRLIHAFADKYVDRKGHIYGYNPDEHNLDLMNSGRILFLLYDLTGEERFRAGIEYIMANLREQPRTKDRSFWHKQIYPFQVWLDGLYMALPFYTTFQTRFGDHNYSDIILQFTNARKHLFDEKKQLYYHGYDESRSVFWANAQTGQSKSFWLRAIGWHLMALVDCYGLLPSSSADRETLATLFIEAIHGLLPYSTSDTFMFWQIVDRAEDPDNYLETSGTAMVSYAILKAVRTGIL